MVSPALAADGDRSFAVTGIVLSSTVAVVAEVQALWVAAFLTVALDGDVPVKSKPGRHPLLRMNTLSRKDLDQNIRRCGLGKHYRGWSQRRCDPRKSHGYFPIIRVSNSDAVQ